ncbi:MAG: adenylate/guanylate cyclase domain-containing protein, partial [Burkholderiales bacterium]|nr:adenylate/guanylate cyclase domain-containing protein [Burkholderiales bacterium]
MQSYGIGPAAGAPPVCCVGACVITDAEHFTAVAEAIDPASAVALINRYLETLFRPVYANGGFISDVKGDGVLAVWTGGASDAELRARVCRACLQMADTPALARSSRPAHALRTRVGAYFGPIALARVGALAHYEYRAVGDTVNTASRLEALNKTLGTRLLVSAALVEGLDEFLFRDLGEFALRGKRNQVRVCELVATRAQASPRERRLCEDYAAA